MPPPRSPRSHDPFPAPCAAPGLPLGVGTTGLNAADRSRRDAEAFVNFSGIAHQEPGRGRRECKRSASPLGPPGLPSQLATTLAVLTPDTEQQLRRQERPLAAGAGKLCSAQAAPPVPANGDFRAPSDALHWVQNRSNSTAGAGASSKSKRAVGSGRNFPVLGWPPQGGLGLREGGLTAELAKALRQVFSSFLRPTQGASPRPQREG